MKDDIIKLLQVKMGLPNKIITEKTLWVVVSSICDVLLEKGMVRIPDLGSLKIVDAPPRKGRNPRTGEILDIPARKVIKFTPSKKLKDTVQ